MARWGVKIGVGAVLVSALVGLCAGACRACVLCRFARGLRGEAAGAAVAAGERPPTAEERTRDFEVRRELAAVGPAAPGAAHGAGRAAPALSAVLGFSHTECGCSAAAGAGGDEVHGAAWYVAPGLEVALTPRWTAGLSVRALVADLRGERSDEAPEAALTFSVRF